MTDQNRIDQKTEQQTDDGRTQLRLEQFSEFVLLFILEVLKAGDTKKEKPRVPLPQ